MTISSENNVDKRKTVRYTGLFSALQSSYWMSFCSLMGFAVVLLTARDFTASQIGMILASASIASIIMQPILAAVVSRYPRYGLRRLLLASLTLAILTSLMLIPPDGRFGLTVTIFILFGLTEIALQSFVNSFFMQFVNAGYPLNFGLTRGIGSISFAFCGAGMGFLIGRIGPSVIMPIHICFLILTIIATLALKPPETVSGVPMLAHPSENGSIRQILRGRPEISGLLLACVFAFASYGALSTFTLMIIHQVGGTDADLGLVLFLTAVCEAPAMFLYTRLESRLGSRRLLMVSFLFLLAKPILFAISPTMTVLLLVQPVQFAGYGLFIPSSVHYISEILPKSQQVRGQAMMTTASFGIGIVIGNFAGGWSIELGGVNALLILCIASAAIGAILLFLTGLISRRYHSVAGGKSDV